MKSSQAALATVMLMVSCAGARANIVEEAIGITFPDRIGNMVLKGRTPFPDPRLGAVIRYEEDGRDLRAGGLTVGVYVYNGGLSHLSGDLDSRQMRLNFREVISEVKQMQTLGKVKTVDLPPDGEHVTTMAGCGPQFLWERYVIDLDGVTMLTSATYMTSVHDNFVKLRISHLKNDETSAKLEEDFVSRLHHVLGNCVH